MVKYAQLQEAVKAREGIEKTLLNSIRRYTYYERLLGKQENEIKIDEQLEAIDAASLEKAASGTEKTKFTVNEPQVDPLHIDIDIAQDLGGDAGGKKLNKKEAGRTGEDGAGTRYARCRADLKISRSGH